MGAVGARQLRRLRLLLPLLPLPLEVRPGHPSATHGQGASRCGHSRVREGGLVLSSSQRPCSLALLHSSRRPGPRLLSPASSRLGLGGGTRPLWRTPSAPWDWRRRSAPSGSPTRVPRSTLLLMPVSSLLSDPHTPLVLLLSWLVMSLAFLSLPWVLLLVFLMFLLLLKWFTTFFLFASLLLTTPVLSNLTPLVLL